MCRQDLVSHERLYENEADQMNEFESRKPSIRQKIRRTLLVLSFILVPVTIVYVSPIVIIMGAGEGVATGSMLVYITLFFLSLFVARLWCGWLCPMGAWQEFWTPVIKRTVREGWPNWIKYGITALWLATLAYQFFRAGGIRAVNPFYGTVSGISITSLQVLVVVTGLFLSFLAVALIAGRRGSCHILCPIAGIMVFGRKVQNLIGWPALRLGADPSLCIDCQKCSRGCPMGLDVHGMVRKGQMESADCILCANCADTCPKGAITYSVR